MAVRGGRRRTFFGQNKLLRRKGKVGEVLLSVLGDCCELVRFILRVRRYAFLGVDPPRATCACIAWEAPAFSQAAITRAAARALYAFRAIASALLKRNLATRQTPPKGVAQRRSYLARRQGRDEKGVIVNNVYDEAGKEGKRTAQRPARGQRRLWNGRRVRSCAIRTRGTCNGSPEYNAINGEGQ